MPDGKDILREWQDAMQLIADAARGATGRAELPKVLLAPMQRQLELLQEVVERERKLQADILGRLLDPMDGVLNLLEESGKTFRAQAEIYESTIRALREPAELARRVSGAKPRPRGGGSGTKSKGKKQS